MPFETAKAVAATFCYNIRFALTPLFGTDFPSQCIQPHERAFGKMTIDPEIIKRATELSRRYFQMEFESKSIVHAQNRLMSPEDVARLPGAGAGAGAVWSEGSTCSNNTFTPINLSTTQPGPPRVSSHSKILTSDTLPSIKEALGVESFEYLCANPLKRRLLNDVHIHDEQDAKMISSRPLISMARLPVSLRKLCAEDGFTDEVSLDDDASAYSSDSDIDSSDPDSDIISELDISSECSMLSKAHRSQHKIHTRKEDKVHSKKRKATKVSSRRHQQKQVVSPFSPPPTAPLSSSESPTSVKHHHHKTKKHSRGDDLTAAETLLALRSGSSTLSEDESEDERLHVKNAKKRSRHQHHHQKKHKAGARGGLERFSLTVNSQSDLIERMAKRLRRASF